MRVNMCDGYTAYPCDALVGGVPTSTVVENHEAILLLRPHLREQVPEEVRAAELARPWGIVVEAFTPLSGLEWAWSTVLHAMRQACLWNVSPHVLPMPDDSQHLIRWRWSEPVPACVEAAMQWAALSLVAQVKDDYDRHRSLMSTPLHQERCGQPVL